MILTTVRAASNNSLVNYVSDNSSVHHSLKNVSVAV